MACAAGAGAPRGSRRFSMASRKRRHRPERTADRKPEPGPRQPAAAGHSPPKRRAGLALVAVAIVAGAGASWWWLARRPARPSVLLVTIDTLRADHVGAYGHTTAATPALDGLAAHGVRFANAHAAAPLTGPSHASILTGEYPPVHGVRENVNFLVDPRHPNLAERLKAAGYATGAFIGAYPVAAAFGFGRGFDVFDEGLHPNPGIGQGAERPGNEVADAAVAWLQARDARPFLAWVHFYDPHLPYAPPPPFRERFARDPYDGEIAFADAQLARLLAALHEAGRDESTIVVVLSDHGEGLGEHGEATHGLLLYESTLRVPFVLAGPGVPSGRVVAERIGSVDLVPTLLALLGLPPAEGLPGRSLRPLLDGGRVADDALYAEALFGRLNCRWAALRGLTLGEWKLVVGGETELFHLPSDPDERRNRAAEEPERAERMRATLEQAVAKMAPGGDTPRPFTISAEQSERLASLGYTAGGGGGGSIDDPSLPDPRPRVAWLERMQALQGAVGPDIGPALQEVGGILEQDRGNPFGYFVLASLAYRGGRLGLAEKAFARTLELDPERPVIRQYYGALLRDLGRLADSERELRVAVEQAAADDYITQTELAETLIAAGKRGEAEGLLRRILDAQPKHARAHGALGRLLVADRRLADAVAHLERAAEAGDVEPLLELAQAYLASGRPVEARSTAARVLEKSPVHPWALAVTAHALALEGQREQALALLRRAINVGPRRPAVWQSLAEAYAAAGDAAAAERCRLQARGSG
jgi:choline-sulfatase